MDTNKMPKVEALLSEITDRLHDYLKLRAIDISRAQPKMVGIQTGGVWIAEKLHKTLALNAPLGTLDISFYRDDFTENGLHPSVKPSKLPFGVDKEIIILVDDVVMSGRTVRAALNELFDYGRPSMVILVALIDLNANQLPIRPDVVGTQLSIEKNERIKLKGPEPLVLDLRLVEY